MSQLDIPQTILSVFLAVLQIYVYTFPGLLSTYKKALTVDGTKVINALVFNFLMPVYSTYEISRMASLTNVRKYWPIAIIVILTLGIRLSLSFIFSRILKIDKKVSNVFAMIMSFPAVGSLSLVIGISMCYPGCPLHGEPECNEVPGLLMVLFMISSIFVYCLGYLIHSFEMKNGRIILDKLKFVWYRYLEISNKSDMIPDYFINRYINWNSKLAEQLTSSFILENKLNVDENFNYTLQTENKDIQNDDCVKAADKVESSVEGEIVVEIADGTISQEELNHEIKDTAITVPNQLFINKINISRYYNLLENHISKSIEKEVNNIKKKEKLIQNLKLEFNEIMKMINDHSVPQFYVIKSIHFSYEDIEKLNRLWLDYKSKMEQLEIIVKLNVPFETISTTAIINRVVNPPVLGCLLGLAVGISGLRDTLFNPNHYLQNVFVAVSFGSKPMITMLMAMVGYNLLNVPKYDKHFTLTKQQLVFIFAVCFILYPAIGLGVTAFLKHVLGGIFAKSRIFLFLIYLPFFLPVTPTYTLVVNLTDKYYFEEYNFTLARQLIFMIFSCTFLVVVYFLLIDSNSLNLL